MTAVRDDSAHLTLSIDGRQSLSADTVALVASVCDRAEEVGPAAQVVIQVSGTPHHGWPADLTVAMVSKWERVLRRLERLPATTVAVADGDCGGIALDTLLTADFRVATTSTRLTMPVRGGMTWPGMALYRLVNQTAGGSAVRRAILFGQPITADEACRLHLVQEVTDDLAGALAAAHAFASDLAGSELAIRRQLMLDATSVSFEDALGVHLAACDRTLRRERAGIQ